MAAGSSGVSNTISDRRRLRPAIAPAIIDQSASSRAGSNGAMAVTRSFKSVVRLEPLSRART